jgi:hypothetical protein
MKVILVNERCGHTRTIVLKGWLKGLLSVCLLGAPVAMGYLGFQLAVSQDKQSYSQETAQSWHRQLLDQAESLVQVKRNAMEQLQGLTIRPSDNGYAGRYDFPERLLADSGGTGNILPVALAGSTFHFSTPHNDLEVYKHGRVIDPATYIHRTAR